jgi:hypothetical protein
MAKRNHNVDFVADMQERASHNINPYYWFNRVTPYTMAQWKTDSYFAPFFFLLYSAMGGLWLTALSSQALQANRTFWKFIFDFSDSFNTARCIGVLMFSFLWVIAAVGTAQSVIRVIAVAMSPKPKRKRERKKKYPKRPKNYK